MNRMLNKAYGWINEHPKRKEFLWVVIAALAILVLMLIYRGGNIPAADYSPPPAPAPLATDTHEAAIRAELSKLSWVKDVYVSPGYLNVGVIKREKDWTGPMIGTAVCAILKRNQSSIKQIRFVDIEAVKYKDASPREAEITSRTCD